MLGKLSHVTKAQCFNEDSHWMIGELHDTSFDLRAISITQETWLISPETGTQSLQLNTAGAKHHGWI